MGIQEDFRKVVDNFKGGSSGEEGEDSFGEVDLGLSDASPDDIPTRVKQPDPKPRQRPRSAAKQELFINEIKNNIEDQLNDIGVATGEAGFSTAGYVITDGSQAFSNALVEMARNRPRLLKALEKTGRTANFSKILKYIAAVVFAVMVDMETRDPHTFAMAHLGVARAYDITHPDGPATQFYQQPTFTPPPNFN